MTVDELSAYFQQYTLPKVLRLDRATHQQNVEEQVAQLLDNMRRQPENWRHEHQLLRIKNALEHPFDGQEIPRF